MTYPLPIAAGTVTTENNSFGCGDIHFFVFGRCQLTFQKSVLFLKHEWNI
jgi:hypothetical protein